MARFFLALGAVGDVDQAAELAAVDADRARGWLAGIERPDWMQRRSEAARQLFQVASQALGQVRRVLRVEADGEGQGEAARRLTVGLRELVMVAERFFGAALKLDKNVGADGQPRFEFDLDGWTSDEDCLDGGASTSGTEAGDA